MLEAAREVDNAHDIDLSSETLSRVFPVFEAVFSEYSEHHGSMRKTISRPRVHRVPRKRRGCHAPPLLPPSTRIREFPPKAADMVRAACASKHEVRLHACHQADSTISTRRDFRSGSIGRRVGPSAHAQNRIPPACNARQSLKACRRSCFCRTPTITQGYRLSNSSFAPAVWQRSGRTCRRTPFGIPI